MKTKLIQIMGSPASGKSTLANGIQTELKSSGYNSILVSEAATDYIAENGVPESAIDQMVIFHEQLNREKRFIGNKDIIICDSSSILNYFYFRRTFNNKLSSKDIAAINYIQKEILKQINIIDLVLYVPQIPMDTNIDDGIRFHDKEEINKLDSMIKNYLILENINFYDMSNIHIDKRKEKSIEIIKSII